MKKIIISALSVIVVGVTAFNLIPSYYPSLEQLNEHNEIEVSGMSNADFSNRINSLVAVVEENNKQGNSYIVNSVDRLNNMQNGQFDFTPQVQQPVVQENNAENEEVVTEGTESVKETQSTGTSLIDVQTGEDGKLVASIEHNGKIVVLNEGENVMLGDSVATFVDTDGKKDVVLVSSDGTQTTLTIE